jgi:hypothetical protein
MKLMLIILTASALVAATGCVFRGDRDHSRHAAEISGGVDHGEYPGDMHHGDTMQK